MGKKKIVQQTAEGLLKEKELLESAQAKAGRALSAEGVSALGGKKIDSGRVYIASSFNNTSVTVTDKKGNVIAWATAGSMGFSGPKKATSFAASKIIAAIAEKLKKSGPTDIEVIVRGVGGGRDSAIRSLANKGFNILSIKDATPIPHNGPRPPKVRRV